MASLWKETVDIAPFPQLDGDQSTDTLIIGGGLTGILCAYFLKQAGVDYLLVEQNTIGSGTTGSTTAKLTAQHGLIYHKLIKKIGVDGARQYLQSNLQALKQYENLCAAIDCDFVKENHYVYTLSDSQSLSQELIALKQLGFPAVYQNRLPIPIKTAGGICFPDQARIHPLKFLAELSRGLNIREHTALRELKPREAVTNRGTIRANRIIVTTHFPILNKHGFYFLKLYQHRSYCLALENVPPLSGMYVDDQDTGLSFRSQDQLLILGGGGHRTGKQGGGWKELEDFAKLHYPGSRIRCRWAAQDCMSLDQIPYIGPYSRHAQDLYVATGFNKWGFTGSMVAAQLLTDLLTGTDNPYQALYSPTRGAVQPQLAVNGWEAITNLLSLTGKRCPHLGCALKWNPQEHSWDCPCHGSRFSEDGQCLEGPASSDLKK